MLEHPVDISNNTDEGRQEHSQDVVSLAPARLPLVRLELLPRCEGLVIRLQKLHQGELDCWKESQSYN